MSASKLEGAPRNDRKSLQEPIESAGLLAGLAICASGRCLYVHVYVHVHVYGSVGV